MISKPTLQTFSGLVTQLKDNEVFVFGSNINGIHGAGSAGFARKAGWSEEGVGEGPQSGPNGKSYAIPTVAQLDAPRPSRSHDEVKRSVRKLYRYMVENPDLTFYVTQAGTPGLSGFSVTEMARFYSCLPIPKNAVFDETFAPFLLDTPKYYAGIGSRSVPESIAKLMGVMAAKLSEHGYILRSGNAEGADQAFARGAVEADIFLPWDDFQKPFQKVFKEHNYIVVEESDEQAQKSLKYHPNCAALTQVSKKFMRRNYRQVMGKPNSEFIICWTPDGKEVGGTAQAMRIAKDHDIPIFNLAFPKHKEFLCNLLNV